MSTNSVLQNIQNEFSRYASLLIITTGIFGNICIIILFAPRWKNSCALCLLIAAIFNGLNIALNVWSKFSRTFSPDPANVNIYFCKIQFYSSHAWSQIGRYLVCLACIDRYLLIKNNPRFKILTQPIVIRSIIVFIVVFWHILSIHAIILTIIQNGICGQFGIYKLVYFIYFLITVSLIPPLLLIVFGGLSYYNMKKLRVRIRPTGNEITNNGENFVIQRKDRALLKMVLVESAVYVFTTMLYPLISLEIEITNDLKITKTFLHTQIENFLFNLGMMFLYFNNAAPFYTYLFASKAFRKDTKELFTKFRQRLLFRVNTNS